jgi:proline iminopeptidase
MENTGSIEIDGFKLRYRFKNLTVRIFEKSAHSLQYEEAELFDAELLQWLEEI